MTHDPRAKQLPEAESMRRNAGVWMRLEVAPTVRRAGNRAAEIRAGRPVTFRPSGHYEATSRARAVYARFVGLEGPDAWPVSPPPRQPRTTTSTRRSTG